jgi:hypothetical protein
VYVKVTLSYDTPCHSGRNSSLALPRLCCLLFLNHQGCPSPWITPPPSTQTARTPVKAHHVVWAVISIFMDAVVLIRFEQACSSCRCRAVGGLTGVGFNSLCLPWVFTTMVRTIVAFPTHSPYGWLQVWKPHFPIESKYGFLALRSANKNTVEWYKQALDIVALSPFAGYTV